MLQTSIGYSPTGHKTWIKRTYDVQKMSRTSSERLKCVQFMSRVLWERLQPTFPMLMLFKKLVYLHILCMNINSFLDDANELIILLEDLWVEFVHHIYMFDNACDSLDYDPRLKNLTTIDEKDNNKIVLTSLLLKTFSGWFSLPIPPENRTPEVSWQLFVTQLRL